MSDWFTQGLKEPAAAPTPSEAAPEGDPAIWTVLAEAGGHAEGQRAVASTIANRARKNNASAVGIVTDPHNGYEGWQNQSDRTRAMQRYPIGSKAYRDAQANVGGILSGDVEPPYPYDSFYGPQAQADRSRKKPKWDDGSGVNIGGNLFFANGGNAPADMAAEDSALFDRMVKLTPTAGNPKPGQPTEAQAQSRRFLESAHVWDENAERGSSSNPLGETETSGPPTQAGTWYLSRKGELKQVGTDVPDFMPEYRQLAAAQQTAEGAPIANRLAQSVGQGFYDTAASVNNLAPGLGSMDLPGSGQAPMSVPDALAGSESFGKQYVVDRNRYNLLHGPDAAMGAGRFAGQVAATSPTFAIGGEAPAGAGLVGNLLFRGAEGAVQGAAGSALTSAASDVPVGEQIAQGAVLGGALRGAGPLVSGGVREGVNMLAGGSRLTPNVAALARTAVDTYGLNLRRSQILGAVDRNARVADTRNIDKFGTGFGENNAGQWRDFTRAVAGTFGSDAEELTPQVMQAARTRIGDTIEDIGRRNTIADADSLLTNLGQVTNEAGQVLTEGELQPLLRQVQSIASTITPGAQGAPGTISGDSYLALIRKGSPLDVATHSPNASIRHYAQRMRDAIDDALEASANPGDVEALRAARFQYKNLMTVKDLAAKAGVEGTISPLLLQGAVNKSFGNRTFQGAGPLGELSDIAQTFMKPTPTSGTTERLGDMFKGQFGGGALSGLAAAMVSHDPKVVIGATLAPALLGAGRLGRNWLTGATNLGELPRNLLLNGGVGNQPGLNGLSRVIGNTYTPIGVLAGTNRLLPDYSPDAGGQ